MEGVSLYHRYGMVFLWNYIHYICIRFQMLPSINIILLERISKTRHTYILNLYFCLVPCSERGGWEVVVLCNCGKHCDLLNFWNASIASRRCNPRHRLDWCCLCSYSCGSILSRFLFGSLSNYSCLLCHLCRGIFLFSLFHLFSLYYFRA